MTKTKETQWMRAERLPNYAELHNAVVRVAGEGEQVTAEQVGKTPRDFQEDTLLVVVLRNTEILYSLNRDTGAVCVEYLGLFVNPNL